MALEQYVQSLAAQRAYPAACLQGYRGRRIAFLVKMWLHLGSSKMCTVKAITTSLVNLSESVFEKTALDFKKPELDTDYRWEFELGWAASMELERATLIEFRLMRLFALKHCFKSKR